jgi:hypothetical protein
MMPYPFVKNIHRVEQPGEKSKWYCDTCGHNLIWQEFGNSSSDISELGLVCEISDCKSEKKEFQPHEVYEWYAPE